MGNGDAKGETRLLDSFLASKPKDILSRIERWTSETCGANDCT